MSWMKRAQSGAAPDAGPQPYAASQAQGYTNQQNMYPNFPGGTGSGPHQPAQQQYWQAAPPAPHPAPLPAAPPTHTPQHYNQQYSQVYQQNYPPNANQIYQQAPQYNHNYTNPGYTNPPQTYQQNYYQNQPTQQNYSQNPNSDGWEDNWDWGWEESAKQAQKAQNTTRHQLAQQGQAPNNANNANVIEESFTSTNNTWNWAMEDKKVGQEHPVPPNQELNVPAPLPINPIENNKTPEPIVTNMVNNGAPAPTEEVRSLSDRDAVKERMPNLALGKRFHLENLTPQWSIESQMSQESSDGPQTHSESTYRSENQSRNSNSPGPNTDNSNFNYSQSGLDEAYTQNSEWSRQSDEQTLADSVQTGSRRESHEELSYSLSYTMQDLTIGNHENPSSDMQTNQIVEPRNITASSQLPPEGPSASLPAPAQAAPSPPPPSGAPPRPPSATLAPPAQRPALSPQPAATLPPPNFPPPTNSQNPFKHAGPFGHRPTASSSSGALASPAVVGKAAQQHGRPPVGFEANLETTPDNSERPDHPPPAAPRPAPAPPAPDNLEVAPRGDREHYLQTAHLSGAYAAPPPGLRRMVPGARPDEPPPGLARMVPGRHTQPDYPERLADGRPADGEYAQLGFDRMVPGEPSAAAYAPYARVVTGHAREHDLDGADYEEPAPPPPPPPPDDPRERTMEGENLQDAGAAEPPERRASAEPERPPAERRAEPPRRSSDDTERAYGPSPRRARHAPPPDRPGDRDDRYRTYDREPARPPRDEPRPEKERRDRRERERDESPDARRTRRSTRSHRYETEDTDCYSDRERRRHREGSHAGGRPPRDERSGRPRREPRDRHERSYREIDPTRKYGNRRRERDRDRDDDERRRGDTYSGGSRADSREAGGTDEDLPDGRRREYREHREHRARRSTRRPRDYYDGYGGAAYPDPYLAERQHYEYYERLRLADPAAYMQIYKRLMAARADAKPADMEGVPGYGGLYETRDDRASVHSGRSSAGPKGNDTDITTEMSLPTNLETSTVRSDRMTPHRFSTAHVKGSIASRHLVLVRGAFPVDGRPATVQLLALPRDNALAASPGPLVKGVTHKKSVMEYCLCRVRSARHEGARDVTGYVLLWQLLALLLRQNGVVVGSDIAELLMKNTREYEYKPTKNKSSCNGSRRGSSECGEERDADPAPAEPPAPHHDPLGDEGEPPACVDEKAALETLREYLIYGNRQEALEWAMSNELWGHALQLAAYSERRTRGAVAARFLAATPRCDPLHTLYAALAAAAPPAATCVADERWGDWRPHVAIILANSARPEHTTRTLTMLGDSLASRGLVYCAQFCYVSGGVPFSRHPLAPLPPAPAPGPGAAPAGAPRLALLLGEPRATTLAQLATSRAILATEIYEYAMSLNQDYVIPELQVYKFVLACRLIDCGQYERALAYVEQAARAVTAAPRLYAPRLVRNLADMADRLKYHDPALHEEPPLSDEADAGSPRHRQWLHDVASLADSLQAETSQQTTPQHAPLATDHYGQQQLQQQYSSWEQPQQYHQPQSTPPAQPYVEPEEPPNYSQPQYYSPPAPAPAPVPALAPAPSEPTLGDEVTQTQYQYEDWNRTEEHHAQTYADSSYWQGDSPYGYGETAAAPGGADGARPMITMPASTPYADYDDDRPPSAEQGERSEGGRKAAESLGRAEEKGEGKKGSGWLGGILNKLSLRAPNQMILPDDKNPTIVWDAAHKRWKNLDGEEADGEPPPPPPSAAELARRNPATSPPPQAPGAPPVSNIFKMQKGRHIKKSYVDVFNPSGAASRALPPAAAVLGPALAPASAPAPAYFVPAPEHSGVYSPAQALGEERLHSGI